MSGRLVVTVLLAGVLAVACTQQVAGTALAPQDTTSPVEPPPPEPPVPPELPTELPTDLPTVPPITTSGRPTSGPVTIAKRKTIITPPGCASLITLTQINQFTGATATADPEDKGYCSYTLAKSGSPAGVVLIVLTPTLESRNTEPTTFEGNTAHRLTTQSTTCDLRVELTDDKTAPFRVLWVSLVLNTPAQPVCSTVETITKTVFAKLPDG